ncbi:MAG: hypothetical protein JWP97_189 [Labilithrix sp.]|nr:hypothetical protein [Labilithrix sp.]
MTGRRIGWVIAAALVACGREGARVDAGVMGSVEEAGGLDARAGEEPAEADANADAHADADADAGTDGRAARDAGGRMGRTMAVAAVTLGDGDSGKTVDLAPGQSLVLLLAATPTSGFDWSVIEAPAALGAPTLDFVAAAGGAMGAAGKRKIVFTVAGALAPGEHTVKLGYARSFEKGVAPFKTFVFRVRPAR